MEIKNWNSQKLSIIEKTEKNYKINEIAYDNKPLSIKIHGNHIKYHGVDKFNESKINFAFDDDILTVLNSIDVFMMRNMKNPDIYKKLNKQYVSCKSDSVVERNKLDYVILNIGRVWKYKEMAGLCLNVDLKYKKHNEADNDDIFIN